MYPWSKVYVSHYLPVSLDNSPAVFRLTHNSIHLSFYTHSGLLENLQ